ncbi:MAG TPA: tubulin-like doman-containing protein [Planctomycetota bacterium]|nr:tubulin-like doman-containing protein [Planctomycetota bacterium]
MPATILVGCGGSGIKTLLRLNELMAEDADLRPRMDNELFYIAVDTEVAMLETFERTIHQQMHGYGVPHLSRVFLSMNEVILQPLVDEYFVKPLAKGKKPAHERLVKHWWHQPDGEGNLIPFRASDVRDLAAGAGQCPAVSYFLTWHNLERMERIFEDLLAQIIKSHPGTGADPLSQLNVFVIAGLAGGTGRGCWELIALKIRQMLRDRGKQSCPIGFLYDATVYKNRVEPRDNEWLQMQVNALTGISELSAWIGNIHGNRQGGAKRLSYSLPNMTNPELNVLEADAVLSGDEKSPSPAHNAFLIFGQGTKSILDTNDQYHEMVGTALYARLSNSGIKGTETNTNQPYASLAAAAYEVPANTLRLFFEERYHQIVAERLLHHDVEKVNAAYRKYNDETSLDIQLTDRAQGLVPDERGDFFAKACSNLLKRIQDSRAIDHLEKAIASDKPEKILEVLKKWAGGGLASQAREAVAQTVKSMKKDPINLAYDKIDELVKETGSVENACKFLEALDAQLADDVDRLPTDMPLPQERDPQQLVKAFARRQYFGVLGTRFNKDEAAELVSKTRNASLYWCYQVLREETKGFYDGWRDELKKIAQRLNAIVVPSCKQLQMQYERQLTTAMKTAQVELRASKKSDTQNIYSELFSALFTDPDRPEDGIPHKFDAKRFYRRQIKPVLSQDKVNQMLPAPQIPEGALKKLRSAVLGEGKKESSETRAIETLRDGLRREFEENIHLENDFIKNNFSIFACVQELKRVWEDRFARIRTNSSRLHEVEEQFYNFFGCKPKEDENGRLVLPSAEEFIFDMCATLAATCSPYWTIKQGVDARHEVTVFPPIKIEKASGQTAIMRRLKEVKINLPGNENGRVGNPFVILAYSTEDVENIEDITSLRYWANADVNEWLEYCEDENGKSMFITKQRNRGKGYIDPTFVRDPNFSSLRWKPWAKNIVSAQQEQERKTEMALSYALLAPTGRIKEELDRRGWKLPLLAQEDLKRFIFTRKALRWENGAGRPEPKSPWKEGQAVAQAIFRVHDVLSGKPKTGAGVEWRERILQESQVFWEEVAMEADCAPGSGAYRQLMSQFQDSLGQLRDNAEEADKAVYEKLIDYVDQLIRR